MSPGGGGGWVEDVETKVQLKAEQYLSEYKKTRGEVWGKIGH